MHVIVCDYNPVTKGGADWCNDETNVKSSRKVLFRKVQVGQMKETIKGPTHLQILPSVYHKSLLTIGNVI